MKPIRTERLLLRMWKPEDVEPFAALNADPLVMRHFPSTLTREQTLAAVERVHAQFDKHGWGLMAAEYKGEFIGYIGLFVVPFEAHFTPAVEIGWRLAAKYWNKGLATEGARAILRYAGEQLRLEEVVSFTTTTNLPSMRVMEKIGMHRDAAGDFDHPRLPAGHPLQRHVLYRYFPSIENASSTLPPIPPVNA